MTSFPVRVAVRRSNAAFILAMCLTIVCHAVAAHGRDWDKLRDGIRRLRMELARQDVYTFVTNRTTTPRVAPYIHSQCWVDWLPKGEERRRAYEQEKRDFGLDFIGKLEEVALANVPLDDLEANEKRARQFIEIAEWLKTSQGYGNYMLKRWSEGIACTPLGAMAVDSRCGIDRVGNLLLRIDNDERNLNLQLAMLDEEAPHKFKKTKSRDMNGICESMEMQWNCHLKASCAYFKGRGLFPASLNFSDVKDAPREYAFYIDTNAGFSYYLTMRYRWSGKNHFIVCIYGLYDGMRRELEDILKYRRLVGDVIRPKKNIDELSDEEAMDYREEFREKWRPYEKEHGQTKAGLGTWHVLSHRFLDDATRELRSQRNRAMEFPMHSGKFAW